MDTSKLTMTRQVAQAAGVFQESRTGHGPKTVTVVLSEGTRIMTLHVAMSLAEQALAMTPAGAVQVQERRPR